VNSETKEPHNSTWSLSDENAHATQKQQFHDRVVGGLIRDYEQRIDVLRAERDAQRQRADEHENEVNHLRSGMAQLRQLALHMGDLHVAQQRQAENELHQHTQQLDDCSPPPPLASSTRDEERSTADDGSTTHEKDLGVEKQPVKRGKFAQLVPHWRPLGLS
jgi:uncharacterized membrane protein YccC